MRGMSRILKTVLGVSCALACLALAFFWPGLQRELGAQSYLLFAPTISIDICEVNQVGSVHVGGKLGEDGRQGDPVFVSRGSRNQSVADVASDGTFEGITTPGFGLIGQNVTIGIRKAGGLGTLMSSCQLTQAAAVTGAN
jgi:hypothetical protein